MSETFYNKVAELAILRTLCEGSDEIKDFLYGKLTVDHFGDEQTKKVFERLNYLNLLGKRVSNLAVLQDDVVLKASDENNVLQITIQNVMQAESEGDALILINSLDHYRKLRFLYSSLNEITKKVDAKNEKLDDVVEDMNKMSESYARFKDTDDDIMHIGIEDTAHIEVEKLLTLDSDKEYFKTGFDVFDSRVGGFRRKQMVLLGANSGGGKCLSIGTPILMYDGNIKMVQDIKIGDLIMGYDSKPRKVKYTYSGKDTMYEINPIKGDSFICNKEHILTLKMTSNKKYRGYKQGDLINISVKDYLKETTSFKNYTKLFRTGVDFNEQDTIVTPYYMGLFLGDGGRQSKRITNKDDSVINYIYAYSKFINAHHVSECKKQGSDACDYFNKKGNKDVKNFVTKELERAVDSDKNKIIPSNYLINSRQKRLELLAGLLDTDGYMHHNFYEISTKFDTLKEDILFLARSLGFAAYSVFKKARIKNKKTGKVKIRFYYKINISGHINEIPCRIGYKQGTNRKQIKNVLHTGFKIEKYLDVGKYYGFELEEPDGLFLLGDFTVVHNSAMSLQLLVNMYAKCHHNVALVSYEMGKEEMTARLLSNISSTEFTQVLRNKYQGAPFQDPTTGQIINLTSEQQRQYVGDSYKKFTAVGANNNCRYTIVCPDASTTIDEMAARLKPYEFDVYVFDYINLLEGKDELAQWESLDAIAKRGKMLSKKLNALIILLIQIKENLQIKYSTAVLNHADYFWGWVRDEESKESQILKIKQKKARGSEAFEFELMERLKYMQILDLEVKGQEFENRLIKQ